MFVFFCGLSISRHAAHLINYCTHGFVLVLILLTKCVNPINFTFIKSAKVLNGSHVLSFLRIRRKILFEIDLLVKHGSAKKKIAPRNQCAPFFVAVATN